MGLHDKVDGQVCGNERARDRETIRTDASKVTTQAYEENNVTGCIVEQTELVVRAICNLAETIDSQ